MATRHRFQVAGTDHAVSVDDTAEHISVAIDGGEPFQVDATASGVPGLFSIVRDGVPSQAYVTRDGKSLRVSVDGRVFVLGPIGAAGKQRGAAGGMADPPGVITAPLAGVVVDVRVAPGDVVEQRQTLVVIEAMKMQNEVQAPMAGTITRIAATLGSRIEKGAVVLEYTPAEE
ncbi:MAG: biotin/lipoyl-containing protein [Dehalococcoidia bacterium]